MLYQSKDSRQVNHIYVYTLYMGDKVILPEATSTQIEEYLFEHAPPGAEYQEPHMPRPLSVQMTREQHEVFCAYWATHQTTVDYETMHLNLARICLKYDRPDCLSREQVDLLARRESP